MAASTRVAQRYAKALMDLAKDEGVLDTVSEDMQTIRAACEGSSDLRNFIESPIIDTRTKERVLREVFGGKIGTAVDRFISLLALKGRASSLPATAIAFSALLDTMNNIVPATITTAVDLPDDQKRKLEAHITKLSGHNIRATFKVDPSIVGGFSARFQDKMIDASVRHQLERLRASFVEGALS